jgi:hypothetical protein
MRKHLVTSVGAPQMELWCRPHEGHMETPSELGQDKLCRAHKGHGALEIRRLDWASSGLTDIHHQGLCPGRKDVHHGDHERKRPRRRRSFTPEFKAGIVERCRWLSQSN